MLHKMIANVSAATRYKKIEEKIYPLENQSQYKYWPPVSRIDNAYGDRNLVCSCADFMEDLKTQNKKENKENNKNNKKTQNEGRNSEKNERNQQTQNEGKENQENENNQKNNIPMQQQKVIHSYTPSLSLNYSKKV